MIDPHQDISDSSSKKIKIMIIDDSAVIRAVISRTIQLHPDMDVVGVAPNGEVAILRVKEWQPDVIILDIEMPIMDGLTALPLILKEKADAKVIICSTLSARGADISLKALSLGAAECLLKPGGESIASAEDFKNDLIKLIRSFGVSGYRKSLSLYPQLSGNKISLKVARQPARAEVLAIGSSTGGPKALMDILKDLKGLEIPIVITQHMPKTFTTLLAQHIQKNCGLPCYEGEENMPLKPGCAYVAPGGYHMVFKKSGLHTVIHLNEDPAENFCRPSVNPMLRSLQSIYGHHILVLILTGMGSDGLQSCCELAAQGAPIIAQDEKTSVVWGMPGAVAAAGICSAVLPLDQISGYIRNSI